MPQTTFHQYCGRTSNGFTTQIPEQSIEGWPSRKPELAREANVNALLTLETAESVVNKAVLRFPIEFDPVFTDKGYWPFAIVELPSGECYSVYFAQICSFDLPTMHDPCFAPPGLIVVPEVTLANMEKAIDYLFESGRFFPFLKPIDPETIRSCLPQDWPPQP